MFETVFILHMHNVLVYIVDMPLIHDMQPELMIKSNLHFSLTDDFSSVRNHRAFRLRVFHRGAFSHTQGLTQFSVFSPIFIFVYSFFFYYYYYYILLGFLV